MYFLPYFWCVLLGVDSLRGGLAEGSIISYLKHVLDPIHVLFTLFARLDGGKGLGHNLQFSTLGSSTIEIFNTDFFLVF